MATLRLAIVSDIHADETETNWSYVTAEPPVARTNMHPLNDLQQFVVDRSIDVDYLVAPGDIANQADTIGLQYAWRKLHGLASTLGAGLVGAPGNHDVITHSEASDRTVMLRNLLPTFPTGSATMDDDFWRDGFCIIENPSHRFLVLNSTIDYPDYPVGASRDSDQWRDYEIIIDRGGFPLDLEERLNVRLQGLPQKINVAVLHHHPQEHQLSEFMKDSYGPMRRGDELIATLNRHPSTGRWLVIHGHKHIPQLVHAGGIPGANVVFLGSASLGAKIWDHANTRARNQFHIVEITDDVAPNLGSMRGIVQSFVWSSGLGWRDSVSVDSGLPAVTGFGCVDDHRDLGDQIIAHMDGRSLPMCDYEDVLIAIPRIRYQTPDHFTLLEDYLYDRGFIFLRGYRHEILQLARSSS